MNARLPFSRPVQVASLPRTGVALALSPSETERTAIAAFLGIPSVDAFDAKVAVEPSRGGSFHVTGVLKAAVRQLCVVSLEPFPTAIEEAIDVRFAPPEKLDKQPREVERTLEEEDPPEPLESGAIDVGMLAVEALALGLDPYPRAPGVALPESAVEAPAESPFAALAALKKPSQG